MVALHGRNEQISALGEMSRVLQTEMPVVEALKVISMFCSRLLPGTSGSMYLFRNSADLLELASTWGSEGRPPDMMEPSDCWALRRGQLHVYENGGLRCAHYEETSDEARTHRACVPLIAQGEVLGLLHLLHRDDEQGALAMDEVTEIATTIAEQAALSLANAKLRQVLRDQAIKDPLTGLFNRRYMEETMAREMARSIRRDVALSVVSIDLDHFKKINDTFGHAAGDAVLRAATREIASMVRAGDVACRLGGEEFVLILPECTKEAAVVKAQQICDAVRGLSLQHDRQGITVTASFGVAAMPEDGDQPDLVLRAADEALYTAKRSGRDRVVAAIRSNFDDGSGI